MKTSVYSLNGEKKAEMTLGRAFSVIVRTDLIKRAFLAERSAMRQPYGPDPLAGKRTSAHYHGKRHYRYTMMNREMARMKRIHGQGFLSYTARFVPQAVKGRRAHPPKTGKKWEQKINKKERMIALLSALAATAQSDYLLSRNHKQAENAPIVIEDSFSKLARTKEVIAVLEKLGLKGELAGKKKIRAGRGKSRGRKYRKRKGPLIILKDGSIPAPPGTDVVLLKDLTVSDLAPGGDAGRLCVWTKSSIEEANKL